MTPAARAAWRTLHDAKTRAIGRLERTLGARRAALADAADVAAQRAAALAQADAALAEHGARLDALLAGGASLSPRLYLEHGAWRDELAARRTAACAALEAAEQNILDKRKDIRQTRQEIAAVTARRDDVARRLADDARAADQAHQDAQDDESAETGLARMLAGRAAAEGAP